MKNRKILHGALVLLCSLLWCADMQAQNITGSVFRDDNLDGSQGLTESGIGGIQVRAFDATNSIASTATSAADGSYTLNGLSNNTRYRIEFSSIGTFLEQAAIANGQNDLIRFELSGAMNVDLGLIYPREYCGPQRLLGAPCYVSGDPTLPGATVSDAFVTFDYASSGQPVNGTGPEPVHLATNTRIGATWGTAYQRSEDVIYTSALVKRHVGFGPQGIGGIYRIENASTDNPNIINWLDVNTLPGVNVGALNNRGLPAGTASSTDAAAYGAVGKLGMGGMAISEDEERLYVVNLNSRNLLEIDIATQTLVNQFSIPNPGCNATNDARPWAVTVYRDTVYVGVVCSGESTGSTNDISATIFRLNGASFVNVLSFDLDYTRGNTTEFPTTGASASADWLAWEDTWSSITGNTQQQRVYPQPILSNIAFDPEGFVVVGLMDRLGHQTGFRQADVFGFDPGGTLGFYGESAGDVLRLARNGQVYTLENNGTSGGVTSLGANNGEGPGGGEFYGGEGIGPIGNNPPVIHSETFIGGLVSLPGVGEVAMNVFDPVDEFSAGQKWLSHTTGRDLRFYELIPDQWNGGAGSTEGPLGKAAGLGDLVALCEPAPLLIGNYVWLDADNDGIQDADENGLSGVNVALFDANGNQVATTVTDANGHYTFTTADGVEVRTNYFVVLGSGQFNGGNLTISGISYSLVASNQGAGATQDLIDSDGIVGNTGSGDPAFTNGLPFVAVTTETQGWVDQSFDFGFFAPSFDIGDFVWEDDGNGLQDVGEPGIQGVTVTLYNSGGAQIATTVTDASGGYEFINVISGTYYVEFNVTTNTSGTVYTPSPNIGALTDGNNSNPNPNLMASVNNVRTPDFILSGMDNRTIDAGFIPLMFEWIDCDGDGLTGTDDPDSDNDQILDINEDGGAGVDPTADSDNDGIPNYIDFADATPGFPAFVDANGDGINDIFDADLDGIPNFCDLDSDNDGIIDRQENQCAVVYPVPGFDGHWPLDGSTNDVSGNGNNLVNGSVGFTADAILGAQSATFNGSTNFLDYSDGVFLNQAITNFTHSFWVRTSTTTGIQVLLDEGGTGNGIAVRLNGGTLEAVAREGGNPSTVISQAYPTDGDWHYIAFVYANGDYTLYLDGSSINTVNSGFGQLGGHGSDHGYGARRGGDAFGVGGNGGFLTGQMDEILHYPTALPATDIAALFTLGSGLCDEDVDGTPNYIDLDSDNDGCTDADEAGHGLSNTNGVLTGIVGENGFIDALETPVESGSFNYTLATTNGELDFLNENERALCPIFARPTELCVGDSILPFTFQNPVLESGSDLQVGAVYRFSNVTTNVDALVEVVAFNNGASLNEIDGTGSGPNSAFQPVLNPSGANSSVDFTFNFVASGSSTTPVQIVSAHAGAIDIDGGGTIREFVELSPINSFIIENPTELVQSFIGGVGRFESATATVVPGIDPNETEHAAAARIENTSTFNYRIGTFNDGTERLFSLYFECIPFGNPVSFEDKDGDQIQDHVDLDDDNDGIPDLTEYGCDEQLLDWDTEVFPAGSTSENYAPGNISLALTFDGNFAANFPQEQVLNGRGGFTGNTTAIALNGANVNEAHTATMRFNSVVTNGRFSIYDIDLSDQVTVEAFYNGVAVPVTLVADNAVGTDFAISNNTATGNGGNDNNQNSTLNVTVPGDFTSIRITGLFTNAGIQGAFFVAITDVRFCEPADTDGDDIPDFCDLNSDDDCLSDAEEANGAQLPANMTSMGAFDTTYAIANDANNNGLVDDVDPAQGGTAFVIGNVDMDGALDPYDADSGPGVTIAANRVLNADLDVRGDVILPAGVTLDLNGFTLSVGGNLTIDGDFIANGGTVIMNSARCPQVMCFGGTVQFDNLTIDNPIGVSHECGCIEVAQVLDLENGAFDICTADCFTMLSADAIQSSIDPTGTGTIPCEITLNRNKTGCGVDGFISLASPFESNTYNDWLDDVLLTGFPGTPFPAFWPILTSIRSLMQETLTLDGKFRGT